jgi:hypothetical protein
MENDVAEVCLFIAYVRMLDVGYCRLRLYWTGFVRTCHYEIFFYHILTFAPLTSDVIRPGVRQSNMNEIKGKVNPICTVSGNK